MVRAEKEYACECHLSPHLNNSGRLSDFRRTRLNATPLPSDGDSEITDFMIA
jgi:hypothetical protein